MKSPLLQFADDPENYTHLQVCRSATGFYIGSMYKNPEGYTEPGTRYSDYYPKEVDAERALQTKSWIQRAHP